MIAAVSGDPYRRPFATIDTREQKADVDKRAASAAHGRHSARRNEEEERGLPNPSEGRGDQPASITSIAATMSRM